MRNQRILQVILALWLCSLALAACGPAASTAVPSNAPLPTQPTGRGCGDGICDGPENAQNCPRDCAQTTDLPAGTPVPATAATSQPTAQPNIVLILVDDLDAAGFAYMPKMQALIAEQGTTFSNFFISMPLCCPSRATILRGQYGHNTQIMGNDLPFGGFSKFAELGEEDSTCATWLQEAGYWTMLAGKYLNAFPQENDLLHIPPGWTEWYSPMGGVPYTEYNYSLNEGGQEVAYGETPDDYGTDVYARKTLEFIQRSIDAGKPFFANVSVYAPHWPTTPAPRHADLFADAQTPRTPNFNEEDVSDKPSYIRELPLLTEADIARIDEEWRNRLRSMQAVDELIESVVNLLESTGQLDNTYIFVTSDNGYHLGNHRQLLGKTAPYDEEIRVMMFVRGPGVPAGRTLDHLTGNVDLGPTWGEIAGISWPDFVDGRSLAPLLRDNPPPTEQWRQAFLLEHAPYELPRRPAGLAVALPLVTARTPAGLLEPPDPEDRYTSGTPAAQGETGEAPPYRALRTAHYLYVEYPTDERELYDLRDDPYMLENIVPTADPQLLEQLAARVLELQSCSGADCRTVEDKPLP
jgi:N-acetylglucosamine-6-sulfatase